MAFDHFNMTLNNENDDLFEDMDEDVMEGINVTDADFNFFDGPDGEDFAMLDVEEPRQIKQEPEPLKEKEVSSPVEPKVKMESSDEKSIAGITTQPTVPVIGYRTTESDHDNDKQELMQVEVDRAPPPSTMPPENMARAPDTTTEPSPPLDPVSIQKRLLPSPKEKLDPETPHRQTVTSHRDSIFDPVSFSRKLSLSDAKYHGSRFSFPLDRLKGVPDAFKNLSKVPTNPRNFPLLAKLRTAISTSLTHSQQDMLGIDDGDLTDSSSDIFSQEEDEGENESICPEPPSTNLILPGKRKFPVPGNATPLSSVSIAESVGPENLDISGLQTEDSCLNWFEPNPWDWSLTDLPPPSEISAPVSRKDIPSFSPVITSLPNTPTSQPEMTVEPPEERSTLSGKDSIAVAQIVTDQIVSTTLDLFNEDITASRSLDLAKVQEAWGRNSAESKLRSVIKTVFPKAIDCNVVKLASLPDVFSDNPPSANKNQPRPQPRRQVDGSASPGAHIYPIPPPYIRVRRSDALWDLLPPALSFWEPLGLAPCSGPKNVVPFCIYPHSEAIRPCLESFLVSIQIAYESCRLGNHSRMETVPEFHGGLVPCRMHQVSSSRTVFKTLRDVCIQLGKLLGGRHSQMREKDETQKIDAFVIYMVDTFQTPSSLWEMCSAFWTLFQAYQGPQGRADFFPKPDLVLQILPINYIASFEVPTILDSSVYIGLAREIYDRCPPSAPSEDRSPLSIYSAPAFQLEESLPKTIQFKFVNEPPQDILRESSYMHVGYAISLDGMWITAAWSDNCGKSQTVVSYHVGNRSFAEVAKEMWQTTGEILQSRRVTWRICLAKAGVMDRDEFDAWVSLVQCPAKLNLFVTLLTVDTAPDLRLVPTIPAGPLANPSTTHFSTNTPGSTPQAGVSPEQPGLTPAATPSENTSNPSNDPDSRLVEVTDETWAVILAHRLHNTNATVEFRPALLSGFLVKRGETYSSSLSNSLQQRDRERGPLAVGVNILYVGSVGSTRATPSPFPSSGSSEGVSPGGMGTPGPPERTPPSLTWVSTPQTRAAVENLMKEILGQFRGLGLLARLKGMQGSRYGTIPWHVAAAVRGVRGVSRCA
jgi:mediator of RNA polymerase II transcription subunit 13